MFTNEPDHDSIIVYLDNKNKMKTPFSKYNYKILFMGCLKNDKLVTSINVTDKMMLSHGAHKDFDDQ